MEYEMVRASWSDPIYRFTCIINCVAGLRHIAPSHLTVLHIPIEDDEQTDLSPYWQLVFQTIDEQKRLGGKVLIFCGMGISRLAVTLFSVYIFPHALKRYAEILYSQHDQMLECLICGYKSWKTINELISLEASWSMDDFPRGNVFLHSDLIPKLMHLFSCSHQNNFTRMAIYFLAFLENNSV